MRTRALTTAALACTAVLVSAVPALADGSTAASPTATARPTSAPTRSASPVPVPTRSSGWTVSTPAPSSRPGEVGRIPQGAPDTGVAPVADQHGTGGAATGTGIAAAVLLGGAGLVVLRRRAGNRG